jgi:hypothetical protein
MLMYARCVMMAAAMRRAASAAAVAAASAAGRVMAASRRLHIPRGITRSRGAFERRGCQGGLLAPLSLLCRGAGVTCRAALQVALQVADCRFESMCVCHVSRCSAGRSAGRRLPL